MQFKILPVTAFQQNCTLLWRPETRQAAIIDPGGDSDRILAEIARLALIPEKILLTHGHLDHVGASVELSQRLEIPIIGPHRDDAFLFKALPSQCEMFDFPPIAAFEPQRWLEDGERIGLGDAMIEVLHCPGHTPGHVVFFAREAQLAQVGDVLFQGSIGRTDFPRGNHQQLLDSIRKRLFPLGDDVRFIPGHGPMSSLGFERLHNPFVGLGAG